jgi:hypothetical protein
MMGSAGVRLAGDAIGAGDPLRRQGHQVQGLGRRQCYPAGEFLRVDFAKVLGILVPFLEREGFRFAAVGAFGLHAYGLSRATFDLDLATEARAQAALVAFLESLGYETLHRSPGYSNHLHPHSDLGRIDLVYVNGETSRLLFGSGGTTLRLGGHSIRVPRAEHLAAMKIHAMRNDPSRTLQEMADIQFLLRLPDVDEEEIRWYFERSGLLERYLEIKRLP